jgi:hypothetical protein
MKRIMYVAPLFALALAGCGGDGPTAATPTASAQGTASASPRTIPAGGYADLGALAAALTKAGVSCTLTPGAQTATSAEGRCDATGGSARLVVAADPAIVPGLARLEQSAAGQLPTTVVQGANWLAVCTPGPKPCDAIAAALGGKVLPKAGRTETPPLKTP